MRIFSYAAGAVSLFLLTSTHGAEDSMVRTAIDDANARLIELQKKGDADWKSVV